MTTLLQTALDDADTMEREEIEQLAERVCVIVDAFESIGAIDPSEAEMGRRLGYLV